MLTTKQMKRSLDEILRLEDRKEMRIELMKLRCKIRQAAYYEADDYESVINEQLSLLAEMDTMAVASPPDTQQQPPAKARMKVIASMCMAILRNAGVTLANIDAAKIARIISYVSGYSETNIRQYLKNEVPFAEDDMEAKTAQALLIAVGIKDRLLIKI